MDQKKILAEMQQSLDFNLDLVVNSLQTSDKHALELHVRVIHGSYAQQVRLLAETDEDLEKESITEAQETAGFHEAPQRLAVGGYFNHLLLWSVQRKDGEPKSHPSGRLLEQIEKQYTSFDGFIESLQKAVSSRFLPGWVWLGVGKSKPDLIITQTNNEDNPLMSGVAEPLCTPIFGIDLWEHAYFAQYNGDKSVYCREFLESLNWAKLSENFEAFNLKGKVAPLF